MDYIRDSQLGHAIRVVTQNKALEWPEEIPGFQYPIIEASTSERLNSQETPAANNQVSTGPDQDVESQQAVERKESRETEELPQHPIEHVASRIGVSAAEAEANLARVGTNAADVILVDWYGEDDIDNPLNWTSRKKLFTTVMIWYVKTKLEKISSHLQIE
jgi:DHA1 family multidrug resistance protein-like MFS transporter